MICKISPKMRESAFYKWIEDNMLDIQKVVDDVKYVLFFT